MRSHLRRSRPNCLRDKRSAGLMQRATAQAAASSASDQLVSGGQAAAYMGFLECSEHANAWPSQPIVGRILKTAPSSPNRRAFTPPPTTSSFSVISENPRIETLMNSEHADLPLSNGWACSFHYKETSNGRYAGVAEITHRGVMSGSLVIMPMPSLGAALACVKLRASQFARERPPSRPSMEPPKPTSRLCIEPVA